MTFLEFNIDNHFILIYIYRKMLTNVLRVLVNELKKIFLRKKKVINVFTIFFILYKSSVKTFLK